MSASDQAIVRFLLDNRELDFPLLLKHGNNEWGFGLKTGVTFIQGQIDLWCELENEIHVLDYKTGSSEYSEKAFEQLSFYTHALAGMKVISESKKIIHSVVYPIEQVVKKKEFKDLKSFRAQCDPRVLEIFKEQAPAPA